MTTAIAKRSTTPALAAMRDEARQRLALAKLKRSSSKHGRAAFVVGLLSRPLGPVALAKAVRHDDERMRSMAKGQITSHVFSGIAKLMRGE